MNRLWEEIDSAALEARLSSEEKPVVIDVRTAPEVVSGHIHGIRWIQLDELGHRFHELDPDKPLVLLCQHGVRSAVACQFLQQKGYTHLSNLTHGMSGWYGPTETGTPGLEKALHRTPATSQRETVQSEG